MTLELHNPHSVLAAIKTRPHDVLEVRVSSSHPSPGWQRVIELASHAGIPVVAAATARSHSGRSSKGRDNEHRGRRSQAGRTSSSLALVKERPGLKLAQLLAEIEPDQPGLWLALDCLQDPHNVGAIFRSASFFGVRGIFITRDRSCPLNGTVYDIATGALEYVPFCSVGNLSQALTQAREAGLWMLGTSEHAERSVYQIERDRPWLVIVGNEEKGLRRLTLSKCDETCSIPAVGGVTSLNASVAAGCLLAILSAPAG